MSTSQPTIESDVKSQELTVKSPKWNVIVDNDPVNLMQYVVRVLRRIFGFDLTTANKLMLDVHNKGKAVVWTGSKEPAEAYLLELQKAQLSCHLEEANNV